MKLPYHLEIDLNCQKRRTGGNGNRETVFRG